MFICIQSACVQDAASRMDGCVRIVLLLKQQRGDFHTSCSRLLHALHAGGPFTGFSPLNPALTFAGSLVFNCVWRYMWMYLLAQATGERQLQGARCSAPQWPGCCQSSMWLHLPTQAPAEVQALPACFVRRPRQLQIGGGNSALH